MSETPWSIGFRGRADKDIQRLDQPVRQRVTAAIDTLAKDPHGGALRRLKGRPEHKLRVGDWRVIIELDVTTKTIIVVRVLPRGRAYDR